MKIMRKIQTKMRIQTMKKSKQTVTISQEEYEHLLDIELKFSCLAGCGVDNWGGWDDAMEMYRNEKESEDEE